MLESGRAVRRRLQTRPGSAGGAETVSGSAWGLLLESFALSMSIAAFPYTYLKHRNTREGGRQSALSHEEGRPRQDHSGSTGQYSSGNVSFLEKSGGNMCTIEQVRDS